MLARLDVAVDDDIQIAHGILVGLLQMFNCVPQIRICDTLSAEVRNCCTDVMDRWHSAPRLQHDPLSASAQMTDAYNSSFLATPTRSAKPSVQYLSLLGSMEEEQQQQQPSNTPEASARTDEEEASDGVASSSSVTASPALPPTTVAESSATPCTTSAQAGSTTQCLPSCLRTRYQSLYS
jgi:hypothetical protein